LEFSLQQYLESKKGVDDRAMNRRVWERLKTALIGAGGRDPVRILEISGGIGSMLHRMLADGVLSRAAYTLIDDDPENLQTAAALLPQWLNTMGLETASRQDGLFIHTPVVAVDTELETIGLDDFMEREAGQTQWDLIVGHAALDMMDVPRLLPELCSLAYPGALLYFPANFDGLAGFEPVLDPALDDEIVSLYHLALDKSKGKGTVPGSSSRTGRHLFTWLEKAGLEILDAGSSDVVIFPRRGRYAGDEAYFLHYNIHSIVQTLKAHPDLDGARLSEWESVRRAQIENAELKYIAHRIDFLAQVSV